MLIPSLSRGDRVCLARPVTATNGSLCRPVVPTGRIHVLPIEHVEWRPPSPRHAVVPSARAQKEQQGVMLRPGTRIGLVRKADGPWKPRVRLAGLVFG